MSKVFQWDELDIIRRDAEILFSGAKQPEKAEVKKFCDYLEFVLCLIYAYGWKDAEEIIGIVPMKDGLDTEAVNLEIKGETFRERITEESTYEEVLRVIDTESHRDYNAGVYGAAVESGETGLRKKWVTMNDDRVRDSHIYLEGMEVGMEDRFYTDDGDSAMYPGDFDDPANNVNCRCSVIITKGELT